MSKVWNIFQSVNYIKASDKVLFIRCFSFLKVWLDRNFEDPSGLIFASFFHFHPAATKFCFFVCFSLLTTLKKAYFQKHPYLDTESSCSCDTGLSWRIVPTGGKQGPLRRLPLTGTSQRLLHKSHLHSASFLPGFPSRQ